jgi:hypothetical protein
MGMPQKDSFANRIRTAVQELSAQGKECTTDSISIQALVSWRDDHKRMLNALRDMVKSGELTRVSTGVYARAPRTERDQELRQVMWRILRMRKSVTVEDLVEMAGASEAYAREWLRTATRHQIVRQEGDIYRLIADQVAMPELTDNADKLRALREKKKQAVLDALDAANQALGKARAAITEL